MPLTPFQMPRILFFSLKCIFLWLLHLLRCKANGKGFLVYVVSTKIYCSRGLLILPRASRKTRDSVPSLLHCFRTQKGGKLGRALTPHCQIPVSSS